MYLYIYNDYIIKINKIKYIHKINKNVLIK